MGLFYVWPLGPGGEMNVIIHNTKALGRKPLSSNTVNSHLGEEKKHQFFYLR